MQRMHAKQNNAAANTHPRRLTHSQPRAPLLHCRAKRLLPWVRVVLRGGMHWHYMQRGLGMAAWAPSTMVEPGAGSEWPAIQPGRFAPAPPQESPRAPCAPLRAEEPQACSAQALQRGLPAAPRGDSSVLAPTRTQPRLHRTALDTRNKKATHEVLAGLQTPPNPSGFKIHR